jgi:hypothetical protein
MILSPHLNSVQDLGTDGVLNWTTLLFVGLTVIQLSSHQVASAFNNVDTIMYYMSDQLVH